MFESSNSKTGDKVRKSNNSFSWILTRLLYRSVFVQYVQGPGFGLFASSTIEPNEFIIEYVGEVIDDEECERRLIKYRDTGEVWEWYTCSHCTHYVLSCVDSFLYVGIGKRCCD